MAEEEQGSPAEKIAGRSLGLVERIILETPKSWREVAWRVFSVFSVASMLATGFFFWRYPEVIQGQLPKAEVSLSSSLSHGTAKGRMVMAVTSSFLRFYRPSRLAILGWPVRVTTEVVWSSESTANWPILVGGIMDSSLSPAVGPLHFGECWTGTFQGDPSIWVLCPILGAEDPEGIVIASWSDQVAARAAQRALALLARRVEDMIF